MAAEVMRVGGRIRRISRNRLLIWSRLFPSPSPFPLSYVFQHLPYAVDELGRPSVFAFPSPYFLPFSSFRRSPSRDHPFLQRSSIAPICVFNGVLCEFPSTRHNDCYLQPFSCSFISLSPLFHPLTFSQSLASDPFSQSLSRGRKYTHYYIVYRPFPYSFPHIPYPFDVRQPTFIVRANKHLLHSFFFVSIVVLFLVPSLS